MRRYARWFGPSREHTLSARLAVLAVPGAARAASLGWPCRRRRKM